ncbi:uncharacterized protein LOC131649411 [Vicia villosa]|uniref:uncharacterized protein LOC131649411 n=1 Tax=Vicia villosa TaxID=3911 RepID=UPI00273C50CB|nr:uncharacterized protein LOC131649411 [Vicia villosa]
MFQSLESSSPKKMSLIAAPEFVPRTEPINPNEVLDVAPMKMVSFDDLAVKKTRTPHARRPKEAVRGKVSNPSSSTAHEDLTNKGLEYVHNTIAIIVTRILDEKHKVPGISVSLQSMISEPPQNPEPNTEPREDIIGKSTNDDDEHSSGGDVHMADDDVHTPDGDVQMDEAVENDGDVQKDDDNISLHYPSSFNRWKYVYQKRLALERELAQNALESKEIMDLIHEAGLMKIVTHFSKCYEMLVKEFIVNLSEDCTDRKSKDLRKVYVRGKCVTFSSPVINSFLRRSDEAQPELEVFDNKVCQVITANQVKSWPMKGKLSTSKLNIECAMLHKI